MEVHSHENGAYQLNEQHNFLTSLKDVMQSESFCQFQQEQRFEESLVKGVCDRCTGELPRCNRIFTTE